MARNESIELVDSMTEEETKSLLICMLTEERTRKSMQKNSLKEAQRKLLDAAELDPETAHEIGDSILMDLLPRTRYGNKVRRAWNNLPKWYA